MKKALIAAAILLPILIIGSLFSYVLYQGPRMKEQAHLRAFQAPAPLPPPGTVTVQPPPNLLPEAAEAAGLKNPLSGTPEDLERGKVYYQYYCLFCHGEGGGGNGPVGESYMPAPADLRTPRVRGYGDGQLLRAMLTGVGHEPVLEQVVPARHRWYLVLYVRELGRQGAISFINNAGRASH